MPINFYAIFWNDFWQRHPAFHLGLNGFFGAAFFFFPHPLLVGFWLAVLLVFLLNKHYSLFFGALIITLSLFAYCHVTKKSVSLPKAGLQGKCLFKIDSLSMSKSQFGEGHLIKGKIVIFSSKENFIKIRNLPCIIYLKEGWNLPDPSYTYIITGKVVEKSGTLIFKINSNEPWIETSSHLSFTMWRYRVKNCLAKWMKGKFTNTEAGDFITGLSLGITDNIVLKRDLNQLGLQHILAISGFHFSLLASILLFSFKTIFPSKWALFITLMTLTCYFLILGYSPSIFRAWIMSAIYLLSFVFTKKNNSLNNLGAALLLTLIIEPCDILQLGFQFSYLATFALITLNRPFEMLFKHFFSNRELSAIKSLQWPSQIGHMIISFSSKAFALTFAVHLLTIPLLLYFFHQFPIASLFYNLFYPFLVSFSLVLLIAALVVSPLSGISESLFSLNNSYTTLLIDLCKVPFFTKSIVIENFSIELLICTLIGIAGLSLYLAEKSRRCSSVY